METERLAEILTLELDKMEQVVEELQALATDVGGRPATVRERTAAGAFLAQFYMGVENIFKRLSAYHRVDLPTSERWHVELFERFCEPPHPPLPTLFDEDLAEALDPYRSFRHVVHHGYGFELAWSRMEVGITEVEPVFQHFRARALAYLRQQASGSE